MNLPTTKDLQLSWLLFYGWNRTKNRTGLIIKIQTLVDNYPLGDNKQNTDTIALLSSLLVKIKQKFKFNLISLESNYQHGGFTYEVKVIINIAKRSATKFKKSFKQAFEKFKKNMFNTKDDVKLRFRTIEAKSYHITDGLTIFEIIKNLIKETTWRRKKEGAKIITACDLKTISTGITYNNLSDLEVTLCCIGASDENLNSIELGIYDFAESNDISVL